MITIAKQNFLSNLMKMTSTGLCISDNINQMITIALQNFLSNLMNFYWYSQFRNYKANDNIHHNESRAAIIIINITVGAA